MRAHDDLVRIAARDHRDAVRALHEIQRVDDRVFELSVERRLDEVREHLGVRLRLEGVPLRLEHLSQGAVVLDDAVVHDGDRVRAVGVRMRVALVRRAVRGPARVRDPDRSVNRVARFTTFSSIEILPFARRVSRPWPLLIAIPAES